VVNRVDIGEAQAFLAGRYHAVEEVRPLGRGAWSSAYSFVLAGRPLIVRFGPRRDWFEADRRAMAFASPELPVPEVLEVGNAFGGAYAISARHSGIYLEDIGPDQSAAGGPMLTALLATLFRVPKDPGSPVDWHPEPPREELTWQRWLNERIVDDRRQDVHGWRGAIGAQRELDRLFRACEARVNELLGACPERRDLVHGDLLHGNVLVSEDAAHLRAIFSWKNSVRGDFLFDTAWCTFCSILYPGIAALDLWDLVNRDQAFREDPAALVDAPLRHHCYELNIGLGALAWNTWVGDVQLLRRIAAHLAALLERGPLPATPLAGRIASDPQRAAEHEHKHPDAGGRPT
jgi:aminoglycoside phosphotransferase (APT) family kinase protein